MVLVIGIEEGEKNHLITKDTIKMTLLIPALKQESQNPHQVIKQREKVLLREDHLLMTPIVVQSKVERMSLGADIQNKAPRTEVKEEEGVAQETVVEVHTDTEDQVRTDHHLGNKKEVTHSLSRKGQKLQAHLNLFLHQESII